MNRLREIRNQFGMSQQEVADAVNINRSTYANYECDRRQADHSTLVKLADLFQVSIDQILNHEETQPTVDDDELRLRAIQRVQALSDPALSRVMDFLDGLEAGQEIAAGTEAPGDSAVKPSQ